MIRPTEIDTYCTTEDGACRSCDILWWSFNYHFLRAKAHSNHKMEKTSANARRAKIIADDKLFQQWCSFPTVPFHFQTVKKFSRRHQSSKLLTAMLQKIIKSLECDGRGIRVDDIAFFSVPLKQKRCSQNWSREVWSAMKRKKTKFIKNAYSKKECNWETHQLRRDPPTWDYVLPTKRLKAVFFWRTIGKLDVTPFFQFIFWTRLNNWIREKGSLWRNSSLWEERMR